MAMLSMDHGAIVASRPGRVLNAEPVIEPMVDWLSVIKWEADAKLRCMNASPLLARRIARGDLGERARAIVVARQWQLIA